MEQLNSTVVESAASSSPAFPPDVVPAVLLSIFFVLGVPGNIAVVLLRHKWQHLSGMSHTLMLNLAFSDLLCLLTLPPWIYSLLNSWIFGLEACKTVSFLSYCSVYGSQLTVTTVSVQRLLMVVSPTKCRYLGGKRVLVVVWVVAVVLSIPSYVFQQLYKNENWSDCTRLYSPDAHTMAALLTESVVGFILLFVMAFAYIHICRKVKRQTNRLLTSIFVTSFVLWVPYHTLNVLGVAAVSLGRWGLWNFFHKTYGITVAVTFVNSCLNPLLYAFASYNMRQRTAADNPAAVTTVEELKE
ncbi:leukotriene B4 receptor 1-like [Acanthochromis polyacanthus]|uniref:leukotriene B4 receptor 1-like n=1 Tax=Acanthochromis polyacanthus TaxID=80966 RepID=UPI0022349608|nr:leukotriene B4 receptor 1-like [Acanthochromis polyacanthus]